MACKGPAKVETTTISAEKITNTRIMIDISF
jgi:hypothetical protein